MTSKEILSLPDDDIDYLVHRNFFLKVGSLGFTGFESAESLMTPGQRALWVTMTVDNQVLNGGFIQYYDNTVGYVPKLVKSAEQSLRTIGAHKYADILKDADIVYNQMKDQPAAGSDPLRHLDKKWYELNMTEPLKNIRVRYIKDHIQDFAKD